MYEELVKIDYRPELFSTYTVDTLWTQPHLADQMLQLHLDQNTGLASRPFPAIHRTVDWIDRAFDLEGKSICDLGCGPGLYACEYAKRGAVVHGLDFSRNSIDYARKHVPNHKGSLQYLLADYLNDPLPEQQDIATLIYCDLCPLSPSQRHSLLVKIRRSLVPGGRFIFDVFSERAFENIAEGACFGRNYMNGFWSKHDYFAFKHTFRYESDAVSLDLYTIIERARTWKVYNWLTYFSPAKIQIELEAAGFSSIEFTDGFGMETSDEMTFGVTATI